MPGKQVKDWGLYHSLRRGRRSKASAARLANWMAKKRRAKGRRGSGRR
jgi:hypothetical protein